jgi:hypothetical protein
MPGHAPTQPGIENLQVTQENVYWGRWRSDKTRFGYAASQKGMCAHQFVPHRCTTTMWCVNRDTTSHSSAPSMTKPNFFSIRDARPSLSCLRYPLEPVYLRLRQ